MAIKLQSLYKAINNQFDVILHTNSFYDKEVTWIHTVEQHCGQLKYFRKISEFLQP